MPSRDMVAEIPVGHLGLNGNKNESNVPLGALTVCNAVSLAEGGFSKEGGSSKYNSTQVATGGLRVIGGHDWHFAETTTDNQRQIIYTSDGRLMRATGSATGVFSNLATGLSTTTESVLFVAAGAEAISANRKLFMFNGKNMPRYLDGDAATATEVLTSTANAADWADSPTGAPLFGTNHAGRLWVGGNLNDPHRMYYSLTTNHTNFVATGSGSFPIYPGEGERLLAGASFKGFLFLWKYPTGIYYINSTDPSIANWRVDRLNNSIGIAGPKAYAIVDDDIIFLDAAGHFQMISGVSEESRVTANLSGISAMGQWFRDNINLSRLFHAQMIYYPNKREVHCALSGIGSNVNNLRVIIDFNNPDLIRFRSSDKDICESMWMKQDAEFIERPMVGDNDGYVWQIDTDAKNKGGEGYLSRFRLPYIDMSHVDPAYGVIRKNLRWLEMVVNPKGNFDIDADVYIDGRFSETVSFNMGVNASALGSFVLDEDILGGDAVLNRKRKLHGSGRRISVEVRNDNADEDFNISRMYLHFNPAGDKL